MDVVDLHERKPELDGGGEGGGEQFASPQTPRKMPDDLPTSLNDRRTIDRYGAETEMYDAWQGW